MPANRLFSLAAVLFATTSLFVAGCGGDDDGEKDWQGETIVFGSIFSTTGDGAAFGPQQVWGAQLAVNQLNGEDGINGADVELRNMNDDGQPDASVPAMNMLLDNPNLLAVLGPTFSNSSAEAHPVANKAKTPVLAVSNTAPGIVGDCAYPCDFIFRDSLAEADAIPANIETAVEADSPKTAAVVFPKDDAFGESSADTAVAAFEAEGVEVTKSEYPSKKNLSNSDMLMVTASSGEVAVEIIRDANASGFKGKVLGGNALNSLTAADALGSVGKGVQTATAWYAGNDSEENQEFISAYKNQYGGQEPDQFAAQAYAGVELLAEAADEADLTFDDLAADRIALKDALEGVNEETPLGDFSFTADHDVIQPIWIVEMNGKGGFDLVKELPPE